MTDKEVVYLTGYSVLAFIILDWLDERAHGETDAVRDRAAEAILRGRPLTASEREYIVHQLKPAPKVKSKRGRSKNTKRDLHIILVVDRLAELGLHPTRSEATEGECGCSVVVNALGWMGNAMTYDAVAKLWGRKRGREYNEAMAADTRFEASRAFRGELWMAVEQTLTDLFPGSETMRPSALCVGQK
jgi:hypothetical protein